MWLGGGWEWWNRLHLLFVSLAYSLYIETVHAELLLRLPLNEVAALAMVVERDDLVGRREDDRSDSQLTILKCTIHRRRHSGWMDLLITVVI